MLNILLFSLLTVFLLRMKCHFKPDLLPSIFSTKNTKGWPFFVEPGKQAVEISIILSVSPPTVVQQLSKQKKSKKKARQKYVKLAVCVACKVQLISHFVGYVNYYSQDLSVLFRIPDALELFDPLYFLKCHGGQKI